MIIKKNKNNNFRILVTESNNKNKFNIIIANAVLSPEKYTAAVVIDK